MFAVPALRKLPIHDDHHTLLAWSQLDRTQSLTDDERTAARERIRNRANELGLDTEDWHITAHLAVIEAMALQMPDVLDHPNRMPFKGVLTRLDQPSDVPPGGAKGRRVVLPSAVAELALPSLLGMAVDYKPGFDGHDRRAKIGLITAATIVGDAIEIEGFFYAKDFPAECQQIHAEKDALGFSFEVDARIQDVNADPWVIAHCVFTGAAVLYKDLAAFTTTSLAAQADTEKEMELKAIMDAVAALQGTVNTIATGLADVTATVTKLEAKGVSLAGPVVDKVKPHVDALNACADSMEAAGVGVHSENGHVKHLRHMAAHLAASAVSGNVPAVYRDGDYLPSARVEAAATEAVNKANEATTAALAKLGEQVASIGTVVKDLQAGAFKNTAAPERKTISPEIKTLLAKGNIKDEDIKDGKLSVQQVDSMLDAAGIKGNKAFETKLKLRADGLMPV